MCIYVGVHETNHPLFQDQHRCDLKLHQTRTQHTITTSGCGQGLSFPNRKRRPHVRQFLSFAVFPVHRTLSGNGA